VGHKKGTVVVPRYAILQERREVAIEDEGHLDRDEYGW
jgi:hypothetical protein